jgi:hypothetical protein
MRRLVLLLAVLLAAGCGSPTRSASRTAAASAAASAAEPSADVSSVLASFRDPAFAFDSNGSGSVTVGSVQFSASASHAFRGGDMHSVLIVTAGPNRQHNEWIVVGGKGYTRPSPSGPWFDIAAAAVGGNWGSALSTLTTLTPKQLMTYNGKRVRVFTADDALTADQLGTTTDGITAVSGTMHLFVDDAGKLAHYQVVAQWQQPGPSGALIDVSMNLLYSVTGKDPTITPPGEVWKRQISNRFEYAIGYPADMELVEGTGNDPDIIRSTDTSAVIAAKTAPSSGLLKTYVTSYIDETRRDIKVNPESQTDLVIGGHPGKVLRYHFRADGQDKYLVVGLTLSGGNAYFVGLYGRRKHEATVDALFVKMIGTFEVD